LIARLTASLALALAACTPPQAARRGPAAPAATNPACPTSLRAMVPPGTASWLLVRPRAILAHPRLGPALGRAFDDAGDQALFERARRVGYDVRTVERAMVAWRGPTTVAAGLGAFDTRRIDALLWDRLLPPRERAEEDGVLRAWGVLGRSPAALGVWNACSFVAFAEGPGPAPLRELDRLLRPRAPDARPSPTSAADPDALALWHGDAAPAPMRDRAPEALLEGVRDVELAATLDERGVRVTLRLAGALPADAEARVRRAVAALAEEPVGHAVGAAQWLRDDRVTVTVSATELAAEALVPWAALDALADVLRGRVGEGPERAGFLTRP